MRTWGRLVLTALVAAVALTAVPGSAQAGPLDPTPSSALTGVDVSFPQCDRDLPAGVPFAIVGVNGGTAASTNRCLDQQLAWAAQNATGADPRQPRLQLYVNTGNPGDVLEEYGVTTWPTDGVDPRGEDSATTGAEGHRNPYGP